MHLVENGGRGRNTPSILLIIACFFRIWTLRRGDSVPNLLVQLFLVVWSLLVLFPGTESLVLY